MVAPWFWSNVSPQVVDFAHALFRRPAPGAPGIKAPSSRQYPEPATLDEIDLVRSSSTAAMDESEDEGFHSDREGQAATPFSEDDQTLLQQVMRLRDTEGREYVYATLRGEFAAGQRGTTLFVGFCPPFLLLPRVEAEVIEGPPSLAQVVQVQNHGAQIDIFLEEASNKPIYVVIEVAAFQAAS